MSTICEACKGTNTTYQPFSGGTEYWCSDCDTSFPYGEGEAPRRVQMMAEGKFDELHAEMRAHFEQGDGT